MVPNKFSKKEILYGALTAAIVAGTCAVILDKKQDNLLEQQEFEKAKTVMAACNTSSVHSFNSTAMHMRQIGFDSTRVLGIIIAHPERRRDVCDIVERTMTLARLYRVVASIEIDSQRLNKELHSLANSLGVSHAVAVTLTEKPQGTSISLDGLPSEPTL